MCGTIIVAFFALFIGAAFFAKWMERRREEWYRKNSPWYNTFCTHCYRNLCEFRYSRGIDENLTHLATIRCTGCNDQKNLSSAYQLIDRHNKDVERLISLLWVAAQIGPDRDRFHEWLISPDAPTVCGHPVSPPLLWEAAQIGNNRGSFDLWTARKGMNTFVSSAEQLM
jgi:hypothetical protein